MSLKLQITFYIHCSFNDHSKYMNEITCTLSSAYPRQLNAYQVIHVRQGALELI